MIVESDIGAERYAEPGTSPPPLRVFRVALGLTQAQLAARAGVARITVSALERRENVPQLATARALAAVLGVEVGALFPEEPGGPHDDFVA